MFNGSIKVCPDHAVYFLTAVFGTKQEDKEYLIRRRYSIKIVSCGKCDYCLENYTKEVSSK